MGSIASSDMNAGGGAVAQRELRSAEPTAGATAEPDQGLLGLKWFSDVGNLFSSMGSEVERAERTPSSPLTPYQDLIALCEDGNAEITVGALRTAIEACLDRTLAAGEIDVVLAACGLDARAKVLRPAALKALWSASLEAYLVGPTPADQAAQGCGVMVDVHQRCALPEAERVKAKSAQNSPEPKARLPVEPPPLASGPPTSPGLLTPTAAAATPCAEPTANGSTSAPFATPPGGDAPAPSKLSAFLKAVPNNSPAAASPDAGAPVSAATPAAVVPYAAANAANEAAANEAAENAAAAATAAITAQPRASPAVEPHAATAALPPPPPPLVTAVSAAPPPAAAEVSRTQSIRAKFEEKEKASGFIFYTT